jgi:arylsulfatase A-like enzyme
MSQRWTRPLAGSLLVALSALSGGCRCDSADPAPAASGNEAPVPADSAAPGEQRRTERYDLLAHLDECEVRHRGLLLDLGTRAARSRSDFRVEPIEDIQDAEREGATVSRVLGTKVRYELVTDEPLEEVALVVRALGGAARSVSAVLDERRLGALRLSSEGMRQLEFPVSRAALPAGRHILTLYFRGRSRGSTEPQAELDWIRLGAPDEALSSYAAPTLRDLVTDAALDGTPRRALALRASSTVRCPVLLSSDAVLRADLGFWGEGKGSAEVRVLSDGEQPAVLAERKIVGGTGAGWLELKVPLGEHANRVVSLELAAEEATAGGRVLFGDPALVRDAPKSEVPEAKTVVVVIAAGLDRRQIPPWGPTEQLTAHGELARVSAIFTGYRVPSTVPAAVLASLLTGLPPGMHALEDPAARLPVQARMLGKLVKEASGRTAMFTSVPTTGTAFGFDSGWDRYVSMSPVQDVAAVAPITEATKWLEDDLVSGDTSRHLVVVHTRGVHPPWDVTKEEVGHLPPDEYAGVLDPRRGGVVLGKLRSAKRHQKKLADEDWKRLEALEHAALVKQDQALAGLIAVLKKKGVWDSTLFVLAGDVAPGNPPELPFDPTGDLAESRLLVPLLIKFPGGRLAAKEVNAGVTTVDISATLLGALRLKGTGGLDLFAVGEGVSPLAGRGLVATLGDHYSTRFGPWLLRGITGKTPTLCELDVDPACVTDVFDQKTIAASAAWQATYRAFDDATKHRVAPREPASIDPDTGAALTVWGDI